MNDLYYYWSDARPSVRQWDMKGTCGFTTPNKSHIVDSSLTEWKKSPVSKLGFSKHWIFVGEWGGGGSEWSRTGRGRGHASPLVSTIRGVVYCSH